MVRRRPGEIRFARGLPGRVVPGGEAEAGGQRQGAAGEAQLRRAGADGDVGVQHHHGGVAPGEPVPALVAERVERVQLGLSVVRLDVMVAERREPGRRAHDRRVRAEDGAVEQPRRAQRIGVVAHREHEVRVPRLDHRGDRRLVLVPAAEVAHDREAEPGGAGRRGPERALGEHAGARPHGVAVAPARRQAGQPGDVGDAAAGVDAGTVLQGHHGVLADRGAERDDGASRRDALGHGAAGQRDGGESRGDHRGSCLACGSGSSANAAGQRCELAVEALGLLQMRCVADAVIPRGLGSRAGRENTQHILRKLGVPNRLEAATIAHRVAPPDVGRPEFEA